MKWVFLPLCCLALAGCAAFGGEQSGEEAGQRPSGDVGSQERKPAMPLCDRTQRNLAVPWRYRHYRCVSKPFAEQVRHLYRVEPAGDDQAPRVGLIIREPAVSRREDYVPAHRGVGGTAKLRPRERHRSSLGSSGAAQGPVFVVSGDRDSESRAWAERDSGAKMVIRYRIPFAHNIEVLGPVGTSKAREAVPEALYAHTIKLQGAAMASERSNDTRRDKLAVGRALSVRELLRAGGVDRSRITILYRDDEEDGRYVDVEVYPNA